MPHGRVFGGQLLAQSLLAAAATVGPSYVLHSMHAYFLRGGMLEEPVEYSVERLHDGRAFARRSVLAVQGDQQIYSMLASFHVAGVGSDFQRELEEAVPEPESLAPSRPDSADEEVVRWLQDRLFEFRAVPTRPGSSVPGGVWTRCVERLPDNPLLHMALLAFAADYALLQPIFQAAGVGEHQVFDLGLASLDHSAWWHRAARVDEWVYFAQAPMSVQGGRGLAMARAYDRSGLLVATMAQEGVLRQSA